MKSHFLTHSLILIVLTSVLIGCQTTPKSLDDGTDIGIWEGKVRLIDPGKSKKIWGHVTWVSDSSQSRLRVDVNAIFDVQIATFLLDSEQAQLWLYQEKKHYISQDPTKLFEQMVQLTIDPLLFFSLLQKEPRLTEGWKCKKKKATLYCRDSGKKITMIAKNEGEHQRNLKFKRGKKQMMLFLKRSKVEVDSKMFSSPKVKKFKMYQI